MKKLRVVLAGLGFMTFILLPSGFARAQVNPLDPVCVDTPEATACIDSDKTQNPDNNSLFGQNGILTKAVSLISILVGVASVIMIIIGGLQYILASGDPANVTNAKNTILYAIIGLVVTVFARAIISFVLLSL